MTAENRALSSAYNARRKQAQAARTAAIKSSAMIAVHSAVAHENLSDRAAMARAIIENAYASLRVLESPHEADTFLAGLRGRLASPMQSIGDVAARVVADLAFKQGGDAA